jgi:hypothetical protein
MRPSPKGDGNSLVEASAATRYILGASLSVAETACDWLFKCSRKKANQKTDLKGAIGDVKEEPTIVDFNWNFYQLMYTPKEISPTTYQEFDRPFAGYLALGPEVTIVDKRAPKSKVHTLSLDIGVMGPYSAAQETQSLVHEITGGRENDGWVNQVRETLNKSSIRAS